MRRRWLLWVLLTTAGMAAFCHAEDTRAPVVKTSEGRVRGFTRGGVAEFLGIPYAAPPVGGLRWRPPARHARWTRVRRAVAFGNTCPQNMELGVFAGPPSETEDCLYLNVFTVNPHRQAEGEGIPVLVWIHGGALVDGESNDYDAGQLARGGPAGPIVVVTINYRLGLLGYFAHPAIDHEGHAFGNYGVLDQQAALEWVRRNIAAFGGDAEKVTIAGQSSGATSAAAQMISPAARGLFRAAILQSGVLLGVAPLQLAEKRGLGFAKAAGCETGPAQQVAACLRKLTVRQILALQGTKTSLGPFINGYVLDGTVLPVDGTEAWTTGRFAHVPVMVGATQNEGGFSAAVHAYYFGALTPEEYRQKIRTIYSGPAGANGAPPDYPKGAAAQVLAEYSLAHSMGAVAADIAVTSDAMACRVRRQREWMARWVPVYAYEFGDANAPWYFPMENFAHGAAHTIDLQFLFPGWHGGPEGMARPLSEEEEQLSKTMVAEWTNFIYEGTPRGSADGRWPPFGKDGKIRWQGVPFSRIMLKGEYAAEHRCEFWDQVLVY